MSKINLFVVLVDPNKLKLNTPNQIVIAERITTNFEEVEITITVIKSEKSVLEHDLYLF